MAKENVLRFPDGRFYNIEGIDPKEVAEVYTKMQQQIASQPQPEPEAPPQGIGGRTLDLLGSGFSELLGSTAEGIQTLADPQAGDTGLRQFAERRRESAREIAPIQPLQEAENPFQFAKSGLQYLVQSVPELSVGFGSALAGAKVGSAVGGIHPVAKAVGAIGGGIVGGIVPFLGRNTEEFREAQGRNPDRAESGALLATAGVQSALNSVITFLAPQIKGLSGSPKLFNNAIKKGLQGTVLEGSTEAAQDIGQILSANKFDLSVLNDEETQFRLTESFLAGSTIGSAIGVASSPFTLEAGDTTRQDAKDVENSLKIIQDKSQAAKLKKQETAKDTDQPDIMPIGMAGVDESTPTFKDDGNALTDDQLEEGLIRFLGGGLSQQTFNNLKSKRPKPKLTNDEEANAKIQIEEDAEFNGAMNFIQNKLKDLREKGDLGDRIATQLTYQVLNPVVEGEGLFFRDSSGNVSQRGESAGINYKTMAGMFLAGQEMANTLPQSADIEVNFLDHVLVNTKVAEASGGKKGQQLALGVKKLRRGENADKKIRSIIDLAFQDIKENPTDQDLMNLDPEKYDSTMYAQTAAHEAFHILQDTFADANPKVRSLLNGAFNLEKGYDKIPSNVRRMIKKHQPKLHKLFEGGLEMSETEMQANVYDIYRLAKMRGDENPLSGALGGYFDFIGTFLTRFRNAMQGKGFQTVEDVLERTSRGGFSGRFGTTTDVLSTARPTVETDDQAKIRLWDYPDQEITSAQTSRSQLPASFKKIDNTDGWKPNTINMDIGGGKFEQGTEFLSERGVQNFVYDPFNRTKEQNDSAVDNAAFGKSDTVTVNNVLNTIPDQDNQKLVLQQAENALKLGGKMYMINFEGDRSGVGKQTRDGFQQNKRPNDYLPLVREVFPNAVVRNNVIEATKETQSDPVISDKITRKGINVRTDTKADIPYADLIVDGEKTLETRDTDSLRPYVGQRMSIVKTGEGEAKAIGSAVIGEPRQVGVEEFRSLQGQHKVPEGSQFDIKEGSTKFVYPMSSPIKYDEPQMVGKGIVARKVGDDQAKIDLTKISENDLNDKSKFPDNSENDFTASEKMFDLSENERRLSGIDILNPTYEPPPRTKQADKMLVSEAGNSYTNLSDQLLEEKIISPTQEKDGLIAKLMAAFAYTAHLRSKKKNQQSALDWYTKSVKAAMKKVGEIYPEVDENSDRYDKRHRSALALAIAVSSQGMKVLRNAKIGLPVYEYWRKTGEFPIYGEGEAGEAMRLNFDLTNRLQKVFNDRNDGTTVWDFFNQKFLVRDLQAKLEELNIKDTDLSSELQDATVHGSYVLGAKIGNGFYQNLMENYDPLTMDMWFMRTWGRFTGTLTGNASGTAKNVKEMFDQITQLQSGDFEIPEGLTLDEASFIKSIDPKLFSDSFKAIKSYKAGKPKIEKNRNKDILELTEGYEKNKQEIFNIAKRLNTINEKWYRTNAYIDYAGDIRQGIKKPRKNPQFDSKTRPKLYKVNSNLIKNGTATIDSPGGGGHRAWMRKVSGDAINLLKEKTGLNLTNADFQALIWYPEKDMFKLLTDGRRDSEQNISYEEAFREILKDVENYKAFSTIEGGLLTLERSKDQQKSSARKDDKPTASEISREPSGTDEQAKIRIDDAEITDAMRRVIEDPRETQGLLNNKFQVLKNLKPMNLVSKRARENFVNEFINGLEPLARRERAVRKRLAQLSTAARQELAKLPGGLLSYENGAYKSLEFAQQMAGRVQMMANRGSPLLLADGSVRLDPNTKGLFEIFRPIGQGADYAKFQMYVYAKRSQRLMNEGRESLMSQADIIEGLGYENDTFRKVFADYEKFNQSMIKFLVDTGSIKQETADKLLNTHDYIPFYRIADEEVYEGGLFGNIKKPKKTIAGSTSAFDNPDIQIKKILRELKGGEQKIGDLYTNVFSNAQAILSAGLKNVAMQKTVRLIEQAKDLGLYDDVPNAPRKVASKKEATPDNFFTYRENGETKYFDVGDDQDLITALRSFTPIQMQGILKFMQNIGAFFRYAITLTPGFMIANFARGDMAGVVTVDAKLRPMIDSIKGLQNVMLDTETAQEMKVIGGFGGYTFGEGATNYAKQMKKFYRRHDGYQIVDSPQFLADMLSTGFDKFQELGEVTELATREAIYRRLVEDGVPKADAAYEALNLINFNRRGNPQGALAQTLGILIPLVPFLNARIQGLYRTGTALGGTESNWKNTALKGATLMGLGLGLYAISSQNEDWDKEPLHRKLNYYIIYMGDKKFLLPKPFEIGAIFNTIPEVFLDGIKERDGEYVKDAVLQILLNNFEFNPVPQALSPLFEIATNRDFFKGRELESLGQRGLPTAQRAYSNTSEFAKIVGQGTASMGISPIEFEQLVNGYLGSMGSVVLGGLDALLGRAGVVPKRPAGLLGDSVFSKTADGLGLSRFYKQRGMGDPANRYLSEFYEMKREADQLLRGINNLREQGNIEQAREMRKSNKSLLGARKSMNRMFTQINEINDRIQGIKGRDIDSIEKRDKITRLLIKRNKIAQRIVKIKENIRKD